jgi:hypothetical protein
LLYIENKHDALEIRETDSEIFSFCVRKTPSRILPRPLHLESNMADTREDVLRQSLKYSLSHYKAEYCAQIDNIRIEVHQLSNESFLAKSVTLSLKSKLPVDKVYSRLRESRSHKCYLVVSVC